MDEKNSDQNNAIKTARRLLAVLGIALIAVGQFLGAVQPVEDGKVFPPQFWLSVFGMVPVLLSLLPRLHPAIERGLARVIISETAFDLMLSVLLGGLTIIGVIFFERYARQSFLPITFVWFACGLTYVLAFRDRLPREFNLRAWFMDHRTEVLLVGLAMLIGTVLRFYQLGTLPRVIDGDEGRIGLAAQATTVTELANPFSLWENFGSLYLQAVNWIFEGLGTSPFTLRLLPAISGVLAIPAIYLFARQVSGRRIAAIAAFLLASSHSHIHFSRISSVGYIHSTWLAPLELYLLLSGLEKRSSWRTAAAGVLLAIHFRVYLTSQIIVGLILVYMLISFLLLKPWFRPALRQALVFWGGFVLMMIPQVRYILLNPNEFINRLGQDGTFQSGWLQNMMNSTGQSAVAILGERVVHAFMSLIYFPALDFYGSSSPLLNIFTATLFLIGIGLILVRAKSPGYLLLNGYFWAPTLAIAIFSVPPNADSYRMLAVIPPALIIAAVGLDRLLEVTGFEPVTARRVYAAVVSIIILGISILNVRMYYADFAGQCLYGGNLEGRFASYLGVYAKSVDESSTIYLLSDDIYFYGSHASADFLSGGRAIVNYREPMDSYQVQYGETIIASPSRINELLEWARMHPGGELTTLSDCDRVMLVSYRIPEKTFEP